MSMPKMPEMDGDLTPDDRRLIERNNAITNDALGRLIAAVKEHKAPYDVPCPPWCPGDPFRDSIEQQLRDQPVMVYALLRNAVTRLAGYDTD